MAETIVNVMLCIHSLHPTDPGNYPGLVRCTGTPGHYGECEFVMYERTKSDVIPAKDKTIPEIAAEGYSSAPAREMGVREETKR